MVNFTIVACRISSRLKWYKNCKNRLRLTKVIVKNILPRFYGSLCIFILWFLLLSSFFFPRLISAVGDWMSTILPHMVWLSVNLECRSETCCARLAENTALLHGTPVVGVSQTLRHWTEGATCIRQGGHHVGHWPTFLVLKNFRPERLPLVTMLKQRTFAICCRPSVCRLSACNARAT